MLEHLTIFRPSRDHWRRELGGLGVQPAARQDLWAQLSVLPRLKKLDMVRGTADDIEAISQLTRLTSLLLGMACTRG